MNPYLNNYQENQVKTASPEQILIMLYDGAIRFLRQAKVALENGERVVKLEKISRVVAILTELSNTIDFEKGGEIAENLDGLYWYMVRELTRVNVDDEMEPMNVAEDILLELREGWVQAIEQNRPNSGEEEAAAADAPRKRMNAAI